MNLPKLIISEEPILVLPSLATKIGLNHAIFVQQLHYWTTKSKNEKDGFTWVYNSYTEWSRQFPFWSEKTIRRIISDLEEQQVIISGNYNQSKIDQTKWYRINYGCEILNASGQVDQAIWSDCPSHLVNMTRPIPENTTENTTENILNNDLVEKSGGETDTFLDNLFNENTNPNIQHEWQLVGLELFEQLNAPKEKKGECMRIAKMYNRAHVVTALSFAKDFPNPVLKFKMFVWKLSQINKSKKEVAKNV